MVKSALFTTSGVSALPASRPSRKYAWSAAPRLVKRTAVVTGVPALRWVPAEFGTPDTLTFAASSEIVPVNGVSSAVPDIGPNTATATRHRPGCGFTWVNCRPATREPSARALVFSDTGSPFGSMRNPYSCWLVSPLTVKPTDSDLAPCETSKSYQVPGFGTPPRPLPPVSTPENEPPCLSSGTSVRTVIGTTVVAPEPVSVSASAVSLAFLGAGTAATTVRVAPAGMTCDFGTPTPLVTFWNVVAPNRTVPVKPTAPRELNRIAVQVPDAGCGTSTTAKPLPAPCGRLYALYVPSGSSSTSRTVNCPLPGQAIEALRWSPPFGTENVVRVNVRVVPKASTNVGRLSRSNGTDLETSASTLVVERTAACTTCGRLPTLVTCTRAVATPPDLAVRLSWLTLATSSPSAGRAPPCTDRAALTAAGESSRPAPCRLAGRPRSSEVLVSSRRTRFAVGLAPWWVSRYAWMTSAAAPAVSGADWLVPPNCWIGDGSPLLSVQSR